jgi:hypothetical protein
MVNANPGGVVGTQNGLNTNGGQSTQSSSNQQSPNLTQPPTIIDQGYPEQINPWSVINRGSPQTALSANFAPATLPTTTSMPAHNYLSASRAQVADNYSLNFGRNLLKVHQESLPNNHYIAPDLAQPPRALNSIVANNGDIIDIPVDRE